MRKAYIVMVLLALFTVLILSGCDALFKNTFQQIGLAQPNAATLQSQLESKDPVVAQNAQVTIIQTKLQATGAQQIVDAFTGVIGLASQGGDVLSDPGKLLHALIPADMQNDPTKIAKAIDGLAGLSNDFANLEAQIKANNDEAAQGVDAASLAQTALMVAVFSSLEPKNPTQTTGQAVAELITTNATPETLFNQPDFTAIENDPSTNTLLTAAGYGTLQEFFASFTNIK